MQRGRSGRRVWRIWFAHTAGMQWLQIPKVFPLLSFKFEEPKPNNKDCCHWTLSIGLWMSPNRSCDIEHLKIEDPQLFGEFLTIFFRRGPPLVDDSTAGLLQSRGLKRRREEDVAGCGFKRVQNLLRFLLDFAGCYIMVFRGSVFFFCVVLANQVTLYEMVASLRFDSLF